MEAAKLFLKERPNRFAEQQPKAITNVLAGVVVLFEGYTEEVSTLRLTKLIYTNGGKVR